ncbi:MAG: hypothetical protein N2645_21235 [Clostridia bacterium]|nr:hypothetical protein [Clostridia bacterium]
MPFESERRETRNVETRAVNRNGRKKGSKENKKDPSKKIAVNKESESSNREDGDKRVPDAVEGTKDNKPLEITGSIKLDFTPDNILQGFIYSEILGRPKGKRGWG